MEFMEGSFLNIPCWMCCPTRYNNKSSFIYDAVMFILCSNVTSKTVVPKLYSV